MKPNEWRLFDANVNRVREGLRVCEDIARFIWENPDWFKTLRDLRHGVTQIVVERMNLTELIQHREVESDIGRGFDPKETSPESALDLFLMNMQRTKEGLRVLEEFSRWSEPSIRQAFQTLRYEVYHWEKIIVCQIHSHERLSSLRHSG